MKTEIRSCYQIEERVSDRWQPITTTPFNFLDTAMRYYNARLQSYPDDDIRLVSWDIVITILESRE